MSEATLKKIKALLENDQIQEALEVINKALKPALDDEGLKWWNILWDGFPKEQWDGTFCPQAGKKLCMERFAKCIHKHGATGEQIVKALARYAKECRERKNWMKGLETLLGEQPVWLDYLEK